MKQYRFDINKIRELSLRRGWSLSRLCEEADMSRSRATAWKSSPVYAQTVYRIAQVLDVDPLDLIIEEEITENR